MRETGRKEKRETVRKRKRETDEVEAEKKMRERDAPRCQKA